MNKNSSTAVLVLYTMSGFTGLLAEQGIEKYTGLLVGVTASAAAVVVFTYFLGFAIGGFVAARLLRRGSLRRSLQAYGLVELSVGIACAVFTYAFHPAMEALAPDARTAVVTLTHDPKLDDPALDRALRSAAFYIGALGSRKTHAARLKRLAELGHDEAAIARLVQQAFGLAAPPTSETAEIVAGMLAKGLLQV